MSEPTPGLARGAYIPPSVVASEPVHGECGAPALDADLRARGAWRAWLSSLASDASAATAAAHLYGELAPDGRDAWLDALAEDAPDVAVPMAALYGPLLAVECDPVRQERMHRASNTSLGCITSVKRALVGAEARGVGSGGRIAVLVIPLYLEFVRVLIFRMVKDTGFDSVRQIPIIRDSDAPDVGTELQGIKLYASCRDTVIDDLAHTVLAHRRSGRELPQLLRDCADIFAPFELAHEAS
ncbi:MAG: hypothetical protein EXR75_03885 [Myxococcales bacterium]|nr:hypothetical protein [Myxococcales bacterium]